jgi:alpha-glucoside transport system permease protein
VTRHKQKAAAGRLIVVLWNMLTVGLLANSPRPKADQRNSGWWEGFTNPDLTLDPSRRVVLDHPGGYISFGRAPINSLAIALPAVVPR